jgi:protein-tyrosine phosphatase
MSSVNTSFPRRPITKEQPYRISFVCLGNICRSPTAEGVFQHLVNEAGLSSYFEIDSAGTGAWHVGNPANSKSQAMANRHGVTLHSRARQVSHSDFSYFDLIVAMDNSNFRDLRSMASPADRDKIIRLRDFDDDPDDGQVPDPYYGALDGFKLVYDIVYRSCVHLLATLRLDVNPD